MEKIIRSMGDGILMLNAVFSKQQRSLREPADQSDQVKKFKRWLSYEPSKHYFKGKESQITKDFDPHK